MPDMAAQRRGIGRVRRVRVGGSSSKQSRRNIRRSIMNAALTTLTIVHVLISLVGLGSGFVVLWGLVNRNQLERWTAVFLITTIATSVTGFLFPAHRVT